MSSSTLRRVGMSQISEMKFRFRSVLPQTPNTPLGEASPRRRDASSHLKPALETSVFVERFRALNLGAFKTTLQLAPPYRGGEWKCPRPVFWTSNTI